MASLVSHNKIQKPVLGYSSLRVILPAYSLTSLFLLAILTPLLVLGHAEGKPLHQLVFLPAMISITIYSDLCAKTP